MVTSLCVLLLAGCLSGCALWTDDTEATVENTPLKPLRPSVDALGIEVTFVERPLGDPLLGTALWSNLDQVGTLEAATVSALGRNGFRFGLASSEPPHALHAALGMTGEAVPRDESLGFRTNSQRYYRRSGEELAIDTWSGYPQCQLEIDEHGERRSFDYHNARCVFRVKVERMQDGWAKLEFVPEIHHGEMKLRSVPDEFNWTTMPSQQIDPYFDQRFEVDLNLGEMVVLGAGGHGPRSLGHHFFRGGETDAHHERLLIIRLADMHRVDPLYE